MSGKRTPDACNAEHQPPVAEHGRRSYFATRRPAAAARCARRRENLQGRRSLRFPYNRYGVCREIETTGIRAPHVQKSEYTYGIYTVLYIYKLIKPDGGRCLVLTENERGDKNYYYCTRWSGDAAGGCRSSARVYLIITPSRDRFHLFIFSRRKIILRDMYLTPPRHRILFRRRASVR